MTSRWHRLGQLALDTSPAVGWAASHAALPVPEAAGEGVWNVYLSLRDREGRARIGRTQLVLDPAPRLTPLDPDPILDLGGLGAFDDSGVVGSCLITRGRTRYLFYTGWSRGTTVPFYLATGLAISEDQAPFQRPSLAPLLDRSRTDPFLTASPAVLVDEAGWRMWYISASRWAETPSGPRHYYNVRYADSADGVTWRRTGHVCLDYAEGEYAFSRPWVVRDGDGYRMWFAVRGARNHIHEAESTDGLTWTRCGGEAGVAPAGSGWDSDMVEYPCIIDDRGRRFMLYNGNGYGETGVGLARWNGA